MRVLQISHDYWSSAVWLWIQLRQGNKEVKTARCVHVSEEVLNQSDTRWTALGTRGKRACTCFIYVM